MLDVLGDEYIMQHCEQTLAQEYRDKLYRMYVTDALYALTNCRPLSVRWIDLQDGTVQQTETRTEQEVIDHIKNKLRGEVTADGSV